MSIIFWRSFAVPNCVYLVEFNHFRDDSISFDGIRREKHKNRPWSHKTINTAKHSVNQADIHGRRKQALRTNCDAFGGRYSAPGPSYESSRTNTGWNF